MRNTLRIWITIVNLCTYHITQDRYSTYRCKRGWARVSTGKVAHSYDSSHHSLYFIRLHVGVDPQEHGVARAQNISKAAQELRGFLAWEIAWPRV